MVDEFSAFARMPTPGHAPNRTPPSCCARRCSPSAVRHPDIKFELDEPAPRSRDGAVRRPQIAQALTNVLKNAADAIEARTPEGETLPPGRSIVRLDVRRRPCRLRASRTTASACRTKDRDRLTEPYVTTRDEGHRPWARHRQEDHGRPWRRTRARRPARRRRRAGPSGDPARREISAPAVAAEPISSRRTESLWRMTF